MEEEAGNMGRPYWLIEEIQDLYTKGQATKEDYTKALRARQAYLDEIKSRQRDDE